MQSVIGALRVVMSIDTAAFTKGLDGANKQLAAAGKSMQSIGRDMTLKVTAPIVAFGALSLKTAGDFQTAMNRVKAVTNATDDDFKALADQAKHLGATTQFSSKDAADAMGFLAQAGFKVNEILGAMPGTLTLAASAQLSMGDAANIVSQILRGYGKEVTELNHVNDVLVKAFTSANTNLSQLGEAMSYVGPIASSAGVQFEQATAAIALMSDAGIQGSMAGTALRGSISKMLNPTKESEKIMKRLGLTFTDAQGRLLPLDKIIQQLAPHADNAGLFLELFGDRAGPGMAALAAKGAGALQNLTAELVNSGGTAKRVADVQIQGLAGAMSELESAFEGLQIAIAESGLLQWATDAAYALGGLLTRLSETNPEILKWGTVIAGVVAIIGPTIGILGLLAAAIAAIGIPIALAIVGVTALTAGLIVLSGDVETLINNLKILAATLQIVAGLMMFNPSLAVAGLSNLNEAINKTSDSMAMLGTSFVTLQEPMTTANGLASTFATELLNIGTNAPMANEGVNSFAMELLATNQALSETIDKTRQLGGVSADAAAKAEALAEAHRSGTQVFMQTRTATEQLELRLIELNMLYDQGAISADTYARAVKQATAQSGANWADAGKSISGSFGQIADSFGDSNSAMANAGKAFGGAQAMISTYVGMAKALELPFPANIAAVAAVAAQGFAFVASIRSQQIPHFAEGGSFTVAGAGGIDSQLAMMRVTPGERVDVHKPDLSSARREIVIPAVSPDDFVRGDVLNAVVDGLIEAQRDGVVVFARG